MTMKTILLGAAAGLVTVGAAQAADLPMMKAEPVEYVKVCSEFGQGFWYIPGTDTCIKLGGLVRLDARYNSPVSRSDNAFRFNSRGQVSVETNSNSEIGPIHTFFAFNGDVNTADTGNTGSNGVSVDHAYLQFAGITAGYNDTFFRFLDKYGYNDINTIVSYKSAGALNQLAYTAVFGGGFNATVAVESGVARRNGILNDTANGINAGYGGQTVPDIVAVINYDQAKNGWGAAQISGALHQVRSINGEVGSDYGFAVGGGVSVNLPIAAGSKIGVEANYADGAMSYIGSPGGIANRGNTFSPGSRVADAYINNAGDDLAKTSGYSIAADFGVFFTPNLFAGVYGSYVHVDLPDAAVLGDHLTGWQVAGDVRYQLVKNLFINGEVGYAREKYSGLDDKNDTVYGTVRVERDF